MYFSTVVQVLLNNPDERFQISRMSWGNDIYIRCHSDTGEFTLINAGAGSEIVNHMLGMCDILGCDWRIE